MILLILMKNILLFENVLISWSPIGEQDKTTFHKNPIQFLSI